MGVTGAGKSTFINHLADDDVEVSDGLRSCTAQVAVYPASLPSGKRIFLMDTPGFDDTFTKDIDILRNIAAWLDKTYRQKVKLAGLIYLHRIQDNRMQGTAMKNLRLFQRLVGKEGLKNVLLVTTMWENIAEDTGIEREKELQENPKFWKSMIDAGSGTIRHANNPLSTYDIILRLVNKNTRIDLDIQRDLANGLTLEQTAAGEEVQREITALKAAWAEERRQLEEEQRQALAERDREAQEEISRAKDELEKKILENKQHYDLLKAKSSDLQEQLQKQGMEMFQSGQKMTERMETLQSNNHKLVRKVEGFMQENQQLSSTNKNLSAQVHKLSQNGELLQFFKAKYEKKESKFYRKYNPFHTRYDDKAAATS